MYNKDTIRTHFKGHYDRFYGKYLPSLKKIGQQNEYQALCPFHNDNTPSLNINAETGQYFCHGCGKKGNVFRFYAERNNLDLDTQSDFPKILKGIAGDFNIPLEDNPRRVVCSYDYTDVDGTLLFQVVRYEPKTFKQRRPNGNGGWIYDLNGAKRVLYRLPEVIKAEEVLIVEGEKDVETLRGLKFTATTSPMGAKKWKPEYSDYLKGKDVVLIPDNDTEGREHMEQVRSALGGIAKSLKWIDLPDLPSKGDVSDWFAKFSNKEEAAERLSVMIEGAKLYDASCKQSPGNISQEGPLPSPEIVKGPVNRRGAELLTVNDLDRCLNTRDVTFVFRQHIPSGMPIMIAAREGVGKTTICLGMVKEMLEKNPDGIVVWIASEGFVTDTIDKIKKLHINLNRFFLLRHANETFQFNFSLTADQRLLDGTLQAEREKNRKILAVFIDSIRGISPYGDNDSVIKNVLLWLNSLVCDKYQAALVYIDHEKKGDAQTDLDRISGTTAKAAAVRRVFSIQPVSTFVRKIVLAKSNILGDRPIDLLAALSTDGLTIYESGENAEATVIGQAEQWLMKKFSEREIYRAKDIFSMGEDAGFSSEALKKAKQHLGIVAMNEGVGKPWNWICKTFLSGPSIPSTGNLAFSGKS